MLHSTGDSHCIVTFTDLPVTPHCLGPITMKRLGYSEETILRNMVASLDLTQDDWLVVCAGEIDIRCWVPAHLQRWKSGLADTMLRDWAERYITQVAVLPTLAQLAVLSVPPPAPLARLRQAPEFQVAGTDRQRLGWTLMLNNHLRLGCKAHKLVYVDVHTPSAVGGMLPASLADEAGHHLLARDLVFAALVQSGLL